MFYHDYFTVSKLKTLARINKDTLSKNVCVGATNVQVTVLQSEVRQIDVMLRQLHIDSIPQSS